MSALQGERCGNQPKSHCALVVGARLRPACTLGGAKVGITGHKT